MAHHYEVRRWSNGIRTVEIFETAWQAEKRKAEIREQCGRTIPVRIGDVTSSFNLIGFFRELRKEPSNEGEL